MTSASLSLSLHFPAGALTTADSVSDVDSAYTHGSTHTFALCIWLSHVAFSARGPCSAEEAGSEFMDPQTPAPEGECWTGRPSCVQHNCCGLEGNSLF